MGLPEPAWGAAPAVLWDVFGQQGHPVRATVSDMGPLLLSRMLELNDTQEGVLTLVFKVADDEGQLLLDLKDLRAMLQNVADRAAIPEDPLRQRVGRHRRRHPARPAARWNPRARKHSSASPCSTWPT